MRNSIIALAMLVGGCAGQPSQAPVGGSDGAPIANPERLSEARKLGYRLVNERGQTLYCRTDLQTGSHVERETVCLTADQIDELRQRTQQGLINTMRQLPPPVGH